MKRRLAIIEHFVKISQIDNRSLEHVSAGIINVSVSG